MTKYTERLYSTGRELFEDTWKYGTTKQKRRVLVAVGAHPSFAVTKSPSEMVHRGGGLAVKGVGRLMDEWVKKNPNKPIRWRY